MRETQWDGLLNAGPAATPTPEQLAVINTLSPTPLEAEQLYVRTMAVANDAYDRTDNRFTPQLLHRLAGTLVGKSLLIAHDTQTLPQGLVFAARTRQALPSEPGTTVLEADFYLPKTQDNAVLRQLIDTGVVRYVSITCTYDRYSCDICHQTYGDCPHYRGETLGDGRKVQTSFAGDPLAYEAHEVSLCYLGRQHGAQITHSAGPSEEELVNEVQEQLAKLTAQVQRLAEAKSFDTPLEADGKAYRQALLSEIQASHALLGESSQAEQLLPQLAEAPATVLLPIRDHLALRVSAHVPNGALGQANTTKDQSPTRYAVL
ncbi:MAG TPA: hypothetical protein VHK68_00745 [Gemmatimonadales bacterium]|nr:hypothetical protein [Gemmatimonadales bacterium]